MAYACKRAHNDKSPPFTVVPRLDIANHPCLQVLDLVFDKELWRIFNFYHDIRNDTGLKALLSTDIDAVTSILVVGDFNTHSPSWSPPGIPQSHWTGRVEEWAASNLLTLANTPGETTRRGAEHERDSTIDLAWYNDAAVQRGTFTGLAINWEGSLGSDHARLNISGNTDSVGPPPRIEGDLGFVLDPEKRDEWTRAFKAHPKPPPLPQTPTIEEVEEAAASLTDAIHWTNTQVFRERHPFHPKASPWWGAACADAVQNLRNARGRAARATAQARLKGTIRTAKRNWADDYIEKAQLWEVAAWRH